MKFFAKATGEAWNRFFHGPADPRAYALFRGAFGVLLFVNGVVLGLDWLTWFGSDGVLDPDSARRNIAPDTWSVFWWIPATPGVLWGCYAVFLLQILALIAGFRPGLQAACLFVWLLSLHHRNNLIWDGEDVLFRIACFILIWMPSGRVWSIDARLRRFDPATAVEYWPFRLLQIQLACLYLSAVLSKLSGPIWREGGALYYVSKLDEFFGRLPLPSVWFETLWFVALLTWLTVAVELLLVFGVWVPAVRVPTVITGILFHLGVELTMNLFLFQWLMILILSTHLNAGDLGRFVSAAKKRKEQLSWLRSGSGAVAGKPSSETS